MDMRKIVFVSIYSFLGMLVSAYLLYQHYKPSTGSFCAISEYINCDIVNKSIYSEIFGVPVSVLGFLAYAVFFAASILVIKNYLRLERIVNILFAFAGVSLLFSFYLTYIEFFVLNAVCPFCIIQQFLIFVMFLVLGSMSYDQFKAKKQEKLCELC